MELSEKDLKRLESVREAVEKCTATTYDKKACLDALETVLEPKCAVCRQLIEGDMVIVNERKMHAGCRSRYNG